MRGRFVCILCLVLFCFAGCAQNELPAETVTQNGEQTAEAVTELQTEAEPTTVALPQDLPEVDFDLSAMSQTVMYAQVYDMVTNTDNYKDKRIRVRGTFNYYQNPDTKREYFAVLVNDATACCAQGIEFVLPESYKYPDDYPEQGTPIEVIGLYSVYTEDDQPFVELQNASMTVLP